MASVSSWGSRRTQIFAIFLLDPHIGRRNGAFIGRITCKITVVAGTIAGFRGLFFRQLLSVAFFC